MERLCISLSVRARKTFDRLPNDLETPNDGILNDHVVSECVNVPVTDMRDYQITRIDDIAQVHPRIPRPLHKILILSWFTDGFISSRSASACTRSTFLPSASWRSYFACMCSKSPGTLLKCTRMSISLRRVVPPRAAEPNIYASTAP